MKKINTSKTRMPFFVLIVISILFLTACSGGLNFGTGGRDVPPRVDVHKGTEGLDIEFLAGTPPSEIFVGSEFEIGVQIDNKGAYDVKRGVLVVSGYDPTYYYLKDYKRDLNIEGKSLYLPDGSSDVIIFEAQNRGIPEAFEEMKSNFILTSCYEYGTEASQEICVVPDLSKDSIVERACEPKESYSSSGQGAPVAVTEIKQKTIPGIARTTVVFEITIKNKGGGEIRVSSAYKKDCVGPAIKTEEIDIVRVSAFLGEDRMSCDQTSFKVGYDETLKKDGFVTCQTTVDKRTQAYTTPLIVYLDYGYVSTAVKTVTLKKI